MTHTTNNDKTHKMKAITTALAITAALAIAATHGACTAHKQPQTDTPLDATAIAADDIPEDSTLYNLGVLIINYTRTDSIRDALFAKIRQLNAAVIYDYNIIDAIAVRLPEPHTLSATNRAIQALKSLPGILCVERDRVAHLDIEK